MKLADLRALTPGAPVLLNSHPLDQVLYAGLTSGGNGHQTRALVVTSLGDEQEVNPRRLTPAAPVRYLNVFMKRPGLHGRTITIERIAAPTWSKIGVHREAIGQLAVIKRSDGAFTKVCALHSDLWGGSIEQAARSYADSYGAVCLPAGERDADH
ncbi:hypothetical protein ACGFJT_36800 [Actinomadura geliboluensis]|uniref:hypothetical protein n=1 Tax=Actinomadura geliboluensis TaxID=882440 RepID=UPI00371A797B